MLKLIKTNFKTTNDCIILATPLILFMFLMGFYAQYALVSANTELKIYFAFITLIILMSGCFSGWLYMAKKALQLSKQVVVMDKDRTKAVFELLLCIPKGVGKYFLPILGMIIFFLFQVFIAIATVVLIEIMLGVKNQDIYNISGIIAVGLVFFINFLWMPEVIFNQRNPFKACFSAIKKLKQTFVKTLGLILAVGILFAIPTIIQPYLSPYPILYFINLLVYYYLVMYNVLLVFRYYEQNFIEAN